MLYAFCFMLSGAFCAPARAFVDYELYPFADVCGDEIDTYCYEVDALGDCMLSNGGMLGVDCGAAVFGWAGDRWGWRDRDARERWERMTPHERHAYANRHWDDYMGHMAAGRSAVHNEHVHEFDPPHARPPMMHMGVGVGRTTSMGGMRMGVGMRR